MLQSEVHVLKPASTAQAAATLTLAKKSTKSKKKSKGVELGTKAIKEEQGGDSNLVTINEVTTEHRC